MVTNRTLSGSATASALVRKWRRRIAPDDSPARPNHYINTSIVPTEFVIRNGFPFDPEIVITSDILVSAEGEYVGDLTYPYDAIFDGERSRFIAQENQFDDTANKWLPFYSEGVNYYYTWSGVTEPYLETLEYRIGKRVFPMNSLRITPGASLHSSFNDGRDDASSFMIAMAGVINSTDEASLIRVGDTPSTAVEVTISEYVTATNQYGTATLKPTIHPAAMTPFYLVLISDPSRTEVRIASGTARNQRLLLPNQDATRPLVMHIGEDLGGAETLDMNLFEVTIFPYTYGGAMSPEQIIASMADVYGSSA